MAEYTHQELTHAVREERDRICQIIRQWAVKNCWTEEANLLVDRIRGIERSDDDPSL